MVLGVFEVEATKDGALVTVNTLDELSYRIYSNFGHDFLDPVPQGTFLVARVVPLGEDWLISGAVSVLPAEERPWRGGRSSLAQRRTVDRTRPAGPV